MSNHAIQIADALVDAFKVYGSIATSHQIKLLKQHPDLLPDTIHTLLEYAASEDFIRATAAFTLVRLMIVPDKLIVIEKSIKIAKSRFPHERLVKLAEECARTRRRDIPEIRLWHTCVMSLGKYEEPRMRAILESMQESVLGTILETDMSRMMKNFSRRPLDS